jgi:hypothetical protein
MRALTRQSIEGLYKRDPQRLLARYRLLFGLPAVRARFLEFARAGVAQLNAALATRRDLPHEDLKLQLTAIAIIDAAGAALDRWQQSDGKADLIALFDQATDALIDGIAEMRAGTKPALASARNSCRSPTAPAGWAVIGWSLVTRERVRPPARPMGGFRGSPGVVARTI